jgi:succinate dehydrogenase/fumarate reductase flavoprotein subunit
VGFSYDDSINDSKAIVFTAKCVVLCTGPATFKAPGFPAWGQTGDGDALAYRVGASISGKEFSDTHMTFAKHPADVWGGWGVSEGKFIGGAGHAGRRNPFMLDLSRFFQAADGITDTIGTGGPPGSYGSPGGPLDPRAAPIGMEPPGGPGGPDGHEGEAPPDWKMDFNALGTRMVGGATNGMAPHKAEGVFCSDYTGAADGVTGLFAAGDALSSMLLGTTYNMGGTAYLGSCQQGDHVAGFAASYVKDSPPPLVSRGSIDRSVAAVWTARKRKQGYTPQWVSRVLRNTMMPYYVLYVKSPDRMQAALSVIQYLRRHCVPGLIAANGHDLREAHEVSNMLLNAEMKLQAGLFRTESRGTHYREDYPARNDAQWLAWIKIRDQNGKMELTKHPIPQEWRPDSAIPYRARYPTEFPGEEVFRIKNGIS